MSTQERIDINEPLRRIFGDDLILPGDSRIKPYWKDMAAGSEWRREPNAVVFPTDHQQVVDLVLLAREHLIPITPRGAGSGLAGGAVAAVGGITCSMERMNRVLDIDEHNVCATVEPGVVTHELDHALQPLGLFFAGYPMSEEICTIGGNVATNAGGGRAVKYGVTANHVLALEVVTADGTTLHLGGKRIKDVTGLHLMPLFIGSEGVLGIITKITLKLTPRPSHRLATLAAFPTAEQATEAVSGLRKSSAGVPSSIEYIDARTAAGAISQLWRSGTPPLTIPDGTSALLLVEAEGRTGEEARGGLAGYEDVLRESGGSIAMTADNPADVDDVWKLRKAVPWWVKRQSGEFHSVEDVVVPSGSIPNLVQKALELEQSTGLTVAVFGHAGDGNFHINPVKPADMSEATWEVVVKQFLEELYRHTVSLGGTISGEHGIGRKRVGALPIALSRDEIEYMRAVKRAFDPKGIMNPGVLLP